MWSVQGLENVEYRKIEYVNVWSKGSGETTDLVIP